MGIITELKLDSNFVNTMISDHGPVGAVEFIHNSFGNRMNPNIEDKMLRLMLWQVKHSLECLSDKTDNTYHSVNDITHLIASTDDRDTLTTARHIIGALDSLVSHVKCKD